MRPSDILRERRYEILAIAAKYRVANVRVFGSVLRGEDQEGSDLDHLVDALPGTTLFELGGFQDELATGLGLKVDVVMPGGLHKSYKDRVLQEARPV